MRLLRVVRTNWRTTYPKIKRFMRTFEPLFRIVEMLLLILATYLGIQNWVESGRFTDNVEGHLERLDNAFTGVEQSLRGLPSEFSKFDTSVTTLYRSVEELNREFVGQIQYLGNAVDTFQQSLAEYRSGLAKTVQVTNDQLAALDRAQRALNEEFSRRPKLNILIDTVLSVGDSAIQVFPTIVNSGNQIVERCKIVLFVPKQVRFLGKGWTVYDSTEVICAWNFNLNGFIGFDEENPQNWKTRPDGFDFSLSPVSILRKPEVKIPFTVFHDRGTERGSLIIVLPKSN